MLRPFQRPSTPYGPGHRGVDLGGTVGEAVTAAGDGLVLYAGPLADRSLVSVEHLDGLRTTYEPITPAVHVGDRVRRGQVIGFLLPGHRGCPLPPIPQPTGPAVPLAPNPAQGPPAGPGPQPAALPEPEPPMANSSTPTAAPTAGTNGATGAGSLDAGNPDTGSPSSAGNGPAGPGAAGPGATGPGQTPTVCLHWGVHRGEQYLDPLRLVESGRIRLLPWPPGEP
ncbi:MAG TPA: M23 family metallopeptidase [Pseudonocardiaceae bacterium]|nr:M23 family metallopeptidase [Pseudonocardiaceae bacterium]